MCLLAQDCSENIRYNSNAYDADDHASYLGKDTASHNVEKNTIFGL